MGVAVAWDNEKQTIICLNFAEHWTVDELLNSGQQTILMIRSVKHPVYVISDFSASVGLPAGILWQARRLNDMRPDNWAAGIAVTQDPLTRNLLELFGWIYLPHRRKHLYAVKTVQEAFQLIERLESDRLDS